MNRQRAPKPWPHDGAPWRAWLRPSEAVLVVASLLTLVLVGADVMGDGLLTSLDGTVADFVVSQGPAAGWMQAMADVGGFGVSGAVVVIATLMSAQRSWRWWPLGLTVGVVATTSGLVVVTKTLVGREGPPGVDAPQGYAGYFPSGHTATSVVCLGTAALLLMVLRRPGLGEGQTTGSRSRWNWALAVCRVVGLVAGVLVGAAAVLTGYHWMTDVVAGIALGMAVLVAGTAAAREYVCGPTDIRASGPDSPHHRPDRSVGGTP